MSTASVPEVECEQEHASLPVSDVRAAVDFYTNKLGFRLGFTWGDPPTIAGVNLGNVQMFLEQGTSNPVGCAVYFVVGNADEEHPAEARVPWSGGQQDAVGFELPLVRAMRLLDLQDFFDRLAVTNESHGRHELIMAPQGASGWFEGRR